MAEYLEKIGEAEGRARALEEQLAVLEEDDPLAQGTLPEEIGDLALHRDVLPPALGVVEEQGDHERARHAVRQVGDELEVASGKRLEQRPHAGQDATSGLGTLHLAT